MKINLNPMAEMTNEEKETLRAFARAFDMACGNISSCEDCPLHVIHDDFQLDDTCPFFISRILDNLGIS